MEQVADRVFRLGGRAHNFYVVEEDGEALIIDAGCSGEWSKLMAGLGLLEISVGAIAGMVVTHSHADHFGLARRAADIGVGVSVHEGEESRALGTYTGRYAAKPTDLPMFNWRTLRTFLPMVLAGVLKLEHPDFVGTFTDGEQLDLPGAPVAIHTPGHTEGHTMFHSPELGVLFSGDGLVTMDLLGPSLGPQMMDPRFHLDADQALESLDRIGHVQADLILPGHGTPWKGSPAEAIRVIHAG